MSLTRINEFRARAGAEEELRERFVPVVAGIRAAPGCLSCRFLQSADDPARMVVVEEWRSEEAHAAALENADPDDFVVIGALLDGRPSGSFFRAIRAAGDEAVSGRSGDIAPPEPDEYGSFFERYVSVARRHGVTELLSRQIPRLREALEGLSDDAARSRYAPDKWSIKEMIGHLSDTERIFSYRLFRISRGDATPLARFDQNAYVAVARPDDRPLAELLDELGAARAATRRLVEGVLPDAWSNRGVASDVSISARALLYAMTGHVEHHIGILRERYGVGIAEA